MTIVILPCNRTAGDSAHPDASDCTMRSPEAARRRRRHVPAHMAVSADVFPISALLPQVRASLAAHPRLVLEAPPGAGKTTQVPLALLDAEWLQGRKIVMLEPRRVAAGAPAGFMARQLAEDIGDTDRHR